MRLTSSAFAEGGKIPARYTCEGQDVSPPLAWAEVPAGARSLALLVDDPDAPAGDWVHWVLYDLPPSLAGLPEAAELPNGAKEGRTDFEKPGYGGPCPPRGTHRYVFSLYALDGPLGLGAGAGKAELLRAMEGHVLATARLTGRYAR